MKNKNHGNTPKERSSDKSSSPKKKMTPQAKGDKSSLRNLSRYSYDELSDLDEELDNLYGEENDDLSSNELNEEYEDDL